MCRIIAFFLVIVSLLFIFSSCHHSKRQDVLSEKTFEEVKELAKRKKKPFCIILFEPECSPCSTYLNNLSEQFSGLTEDCIFNMVDVSLPENRWYQQWLSITTTPLTCIFDTDGNLSAVLPGGSVRIMECIEKILHGEKDCAEYYKNIFKTNLHYTEIIGFFGELLQCYFDILKGKNIGVRIDAALSHKQTPFGLYLKLWNERMHGTEENCKTLSYQLLSYSYEIENIRLYKEFFLQCKVIIDPDFNEADEPVLFVKENPVRLNNCTELQPVTFQITIKNEGVKELEIYDIQLPCACLYFTGDKEFSLKTGEENTLSFTFISNAKGIAEREIVIVSNGIEDITTIKIIAETI